MLQGDMFVLLVMSRHVLVACRYVINYSPFDVVYKLCKFKPVHLLARAVDQLHVTHHIHHGVNYALKHYTHAYLIALLVGIAKGKSLANCAK